MSATLPPSRYNVKVKRLNHGEEFEVTVLSGQTIHELKRTVFNQTKVPIRDQVLYKFGGPLKEGRTVSHYNIQEGETLRLALRNFSYSTAVNEQGMQIFVKTLTGKNITLDGMLPADTIATMKQRIREKEGIPGWEQCLIFFGLPLWNESLTLKDYNVPACATVNLVLRLGGQPIPIQVKLPDGTALPLLLFRSELIGGIKIKIEAKKGIHRQRQCLMFAGDSLDDGMALFGYGIPTDATLDLVVFPDSSPMEENR